MNICKVHSLSLLCVCWGGGGEGSPLGEGGELEEAKVCLEGKLQPSLLAMDELLSLSM